MNNPVFSIKKSASDKDIRKVIVALSGGADSVATAHILKYSGLDVLALHCNFHLRGEESDRDMDFVSFFCQENNIPLLVKHFDVYNYVATHKGCSLEMACRDLRYEWFEKIRKEQGFDRIATGHNADDNIETLFLNILRGSGTRGLSGMNPDNGMIWRPLLNVHRNQIIDYLKENRLNYITDSSNLNNDFRRNFIRNEIIPLLKNRWQGFDKALDKTIRNLREENDLIENLLKENLPGTGEPLKIETILYFPAPSLLVKRFIDSAIPFSETVNEIMAAIEAKKPHIRRWKLRNGEVILRNGKLFVEMGHSKGCPG